MKLGSQEAAIYIGSSLRASGPRPWKTQQERCEQVAMVTGRLIQQHHCGPL